MLVFLSLSYQGLLRRGFRYIWTVRWGYEAATKMERTHTFKTAKTNFSTNWVTNVMLWNEISELWDTHTQICCIKCDKVLSSYRNTSPWIWKFWAFAFGSYAHKTWQTVLQWCASLSLSCFQDYIFPILPQWDFTF